MNEIIQILFWPFLACLVLTGIHAYMGLHVVERGVIFVDLSLAQVAALGTTIAFLFGFDLHGRGAYFFSVGFTLLGAALFAITRTKKLKIPHEAIIGIVYAVSAASSILIMDRLPEGAEHIKHILVGNLLSVTPADVIKMFILYSVIGLLHWVWRKPFLTISQFPDEAVKQGYKIKVWDFLFYSLFGFVVTSSVAIAGVLLVFTFLIVPPVTAILFSNKIVPRLTIGWILGALASLIGIYASYRADTPTGATVICTFGVILLLATFVRSALTKANINIV